MLKVKRVYEKPEPGDGQRVLVDRLWPRGLRREDAHLDDWAKDLAPTTELRKWFGHAPAKWPEFRTRYLKELAEPGKQAILRRLAERASAGDVTLLYAARDTEHNEARVLAGVISRLMKSGVAGGG